MPTGADRSGNVVGLPPASTLPLFLVGAFTTRPFVEKKKRKLQLLPTRQYWLGINWLWRFYSNYFVGFGKEGCVCIFFLFDRALISRFRYRSVLALIYWLFTVLLPLTSVPSADVPHTNPVRYASLGDSGLVFLTLATVDTMQSLAVHVDILNFTKN